MTFKDQKAQSNLTAQKGKIAFKRQVIKRALWIALTVTN